MKIAVDTDIQVLGHTLKSSEQKVDNTGQHNIYHFPNNYKNITICTQLFLGSSTIGFTIAEGIYSMAEFESLNFSEVQSTIVLLTTLEEFPFDLEENVKELIHPDFIHTSWWAKCKKLFDG